MSLTDKLLQDALIIWATIDPIGTLAIFTGLTSQAISVTRYQLH